MFGSSFLAKRGVREDIATFDARNITHEIRESVEELLHRNKASFDPKVPQPSQRLPLTALSGVTAGRLVAAYQSGVGAEGAGLTPSPHPPSNDLQFF